MCLHVTSDPSPAIQGTWWHFLHGFVVVTKGESMCGTSEIKPLLYGKCNLCPFPDFSMLLAGNLPVSLP